MRFFGKSGTQPTVFSVYICSLKIKKYVLDLILTATVVCSCCNLHFFVCDSCRQQKEEDEELERILQLSLTEK